MDERQFWRYVGVTAGIALLLGGWLVFQRAGLTLDLMLAGAFFVLFYTWPLKYYGLGEPAVLLVWGPLMVGGTYYVLTGAWSADVAWLSVVFALGPTTVLFGKHTDKLEADKAKGVNTLPVIIGEQMARRAIGGMISAQYLLCLALVLAGSFHWPLMLVLLNLPRLPTLFSVLGSGKPPSPPESFPAGVWPLWFSAHAFSHTRRFTSLFLIGVLIDTLMYPG
jgi:1,4-dihydroxy-2-naphthoate octaprenyltransferase